MTRRQVLDYFDETGMLVRSSGVFDGQGANYGGGLRVPDTSQPPDDRGRYPLQAKPELFDNWKQQMTAWVREERNHPCVYVWSVENEITYINVNNLGQYREVEPAIRDAVQHVMRIDPTRPAMVDGGNALRDESLPVNGAHYTEFMGVDFRDFPDAAYTRDHFYNTLQRDAWRMVPDRPIMKGEIYFANGYSTDRFATIGGDRCFVGVGQTMEARGLWAKMLSEGYRWSEVSSWHFWMTNSDRQYYNSWSPVAVLCREWNWTFGTGNTIGRTLKVFNSTRHADAIDVSWSVELGGRKVAGDTRQFRVPPGEAEEFTVRFALPTVTARTDGAFILIASRNGQEVFRDEKPLAVIAPNSTAKPPLSKSELAVFDPQGTVKAYLVARDIAFTEMSRPDEAPATAKVIVLGADAVPAELAADPFCYRYALEGRRVIVLDQAHPLRYQAIPADASPTDYVGRFGFSEDLSHPIFRGMEQADFFTWGNDHVLYRNAYRKGSKGGRSLLQCDDRLSCTALLESAVGDGLLLLSQLAVGERLESLGVAQAVFNNLLNYAAEYVPVRKATCAVIEPRSAEARLLDSLNLKYQLVSSPLDALQGDGIAVVNATPANLRALADQDEQVQAFCQRGGWLMLWGLTPEGLADYNRIVGHEHVIRPFQMERVLLTIPQDPLTAGLTLRDVVMDTGEKMFGWMALKWPDEEAFQYIVDHTDIAPFAVLPTPEELGKEPDRAAKGSDHWPANLTNGFTADDSWRFAYSIILDAGHKTKWTMDLPKEEELVSLKIKINQIYHKITKINLYVDDDPEPVVALLRPDGDVQEVPLAGKRGKRITFEIADWEETGRQNVVGIDNFWLYVKRDDAYLENTRSLLNIGGLMRYNRGKGGIVLNQLNILDQEKLPLNKLKKANVTKVLLANMGAVFAGTKAIVAGAGLQYEPVQIPDARFNAFVNRQGRPRWFSGPGDVSKMPVGDQTYANVDYHLSDFSTSPVPTVFMLKGNGSEVQDTEIKGIRVGRASDAVFFLHTFNPSGSVSGWQRNHDDAVQRGRDLPDPPVVFQYVIHYGDGQQEIVPVTWKTGVGHWVSEAPAALPEAAVAWTGPLNEQEKAVVYSMQWNNPRTDVPIESIDIVFGPDGPKWGAPAVFAITTAKTAK
jgi:beta-galactosidase